MDEDEPKQKRTRLTIDELMAIARRGSYLSDRDGFTLVGEIVRLRLKLARLSAGHAAAAPPLKFARISPRRFLGMSEEQLSRIVDSASTLMAHRERTANGTGAMAGLMWWRMLCAALYGNDDPRLDELQDETPGAPQPDNLDRNIADYQRRVAQAARDLVEATDPRQGSTGHVPELAWRALCVALYGEGHRRVRDLLGDGQGQMGKPGIPVEVDQPPSARAAQPASPPPADALPPEGDDEDRLP